MASQKYNKAINSITQKTGSKKAAQAIIASSVRNASPQAKAKNPKLKNVRG